MGRIARGLAAALLALQGGGVAASAAAPTAAPIDEGFYGPLRTRDLTPFGYLRLDMRPPFAGNVQPGGWAVDAEMAWQNTWALSPHVGWYLGRKKGRGSLTEADVEAIRALPGENYLVDLEFAELDVTLHRQFTPDLGAFAVLSGVTYGGGILDGLVEQFHSAFGMSDYGRPNVARGQINLLFDLKSTQVTELDAPPRHGMLDPVVGVRYTGVDLPDPWQLVLEGELKVPVGGHRPWLSTGRTDAGVQATLVRRSGRHAFYGNLALVQYAGSEGRVEGEDKLLPTLVFGWESHVTARTHSIVQAYASPSVYDRSETELEELLANKYQLSLGLRHQRGPHLFTFAVTENLANFNNTPDIAFLLGWAWRPAPDVLQD